MHVFGSIARSLLIHSVCIAVRTGDCLDVLVHWGSFDSIEERGVVVGDGEPWKLVSRFSTLALAGGGWLEGG